MTNSFLSANNPQYILFKLEWPAKHQFCQVFRWTYFFSWWRFLYPLPSIKTLSSLKHLIKMSLMLLKTPCLLKSDIMDFLRFTDLWILSGTTWVSWYQKKHSPAHTYRGHQSSLVCLLHLLWSTASPLFSLHAWQSFSTTSLQVFFGLPLGLAPSTSYSIHFFTKLLSSFCNTCPYHRNVLL